MAADRPHMSVAVCGACDCGKSTLAAQLLLSGFDEKEQGMVARQAALKEERERGLTIVPSFSEFFTPKWHYTLVDVPGHRAFLRGMIRGAWMADAALLVVSAGTSFEASIANRGAYSDEGGCRTHARLLNVIGVRQLIVCVSGMDSHPAAYKQERFEHVRDAVRGMLVAVGWKRDFVEHCVPFIPVTGRAGDNVTSRSNMMQWWSGHEVSIKEGTERVTVGTVLHALDETVCPPVRRTDAPFRMLLVESHRIAGIGRVIGGRIAQGVLKEAGEAALFSGSRSNVISCEMYHRRHREGRAGQYVAYNWRVSSGDVPRRGDVVTDRGSIPMVRQFTALVQVGHHPNGIRPGYAPICCIGTAYVPARLVKINWGGDESGGQRRPADSLTRRMTAEVVFVPLDPLAVEPFDTCEALGRAVFLEGRDVVMVGKVLSVSDQAADWQPRNKRRQRDPVVLRFGEMEITHGKVDMPLSDAGIPAEAVVELCVPPRARPPDAPAECGAAGMPIYVRAPTLGAMEPVCVEVPPDATVGTLIWAALELIAPPKRAQSPGGGDRCPDAAAGGD
eukprot:TRINITY_DN31724_c0_g1_i2.p1 TRINITY_DN31724_c0_g1~~TRINITY_DN31724_c0_g1_i2.p1  ORF type:complete len:561 (+),score=111.55 TRINITY_DN31724_c0_g1_i2:70-1752(+)